MDKAEKDSVSVDLQDLLLRLTFDNICGLTFGKDPETLSPELPENPFAVAFDTATEATMHRFVSYYNIIHYLIILYIIQLAFIKINLITIK